ncbi:MAG: F0F1 ATP synthase subunit epsilon, partial [Pseudomonadota bacterium]
NHSAVMTTLNPGLVEASQEDGTTQSYFVRGGLADASPAGLTILAEFAVAQSEMTSEIYADQKRIAQEEYDAAMSGDDEDKKANAHFFLEQLNSMESTLVPA